MRVPVGTMVTVQAPGSRATDGEVRIIPAVVMQQWADGSVQLYAFHFEGVPSLMHSVPLDRIEIVPPPRQGDPTRELKNSIIEPETKDLMKAFR